MTPLDRAILAKTLGHWTGKVAAWIFLANVALLLFKEFKQLESNMTMLALQWLGSLLIIAGYWFMLRFPLASSLCTIFGCAVTLVWAGLLEPIPYGVVSLEVFVVLMASINISRLLAKD